MSLVFISSCKVIYYVIYRLIGRKIGTNTITEHIIKNEKIVDAVTCVKPVW